MNLANIKALDEAALAGLASRGLLRRAQKDLERELPEVREDTTERMVLEFAAEGCAVTVPASGPQSATCTCPAEDVCRHVLAALLFLREYEANGAPTEAPGDAVGEEIMALGEEELAAWGGRQLFRRALDDLGGVAAGEIEESARVVTIGLPQVGATVRWLAGAGLTGTLCSCKQAAPCRHRIAALLVYRAAHGLELPPREERVPAEPAGAPVSRAELLATVRGAISALVASGFGRLPRSGVGRLWTLAVAAHGLDLPRLERELRDLADAVLWHVERDVRADSAALLAGLAQVYALVRALEVSGGLPELVGEHRAQYHPVGTLELVGLGALQWRTRAGYAGLTVYFWDVRGKRMASWSDSRPSFYGGQRFEPAESYRQGGLWGTVTAPRVACRSALLLSNARRSRDGRLSNAPGVQARIDGPTEAEALELAGVRFDDWAVLAQHVAATRVSGLRDAGALDGLVVVAPGKWSAAHYDEARQVLIRPVLDGEGRSIRLVMPHATGWPFAVDTLEAWAPDQWATWGVLGVARLAAGGLEVEPVSLLNREPVPATGSTIVNLTLDEVGAPAAHPSPVEREGADGDGRPASSVVRSGGLRRLLAAAVGELEQLAESGLMGAGVSSIDRLRDLGEQLQRLGLSVVAGAVAGLVAVLDGNRHSTAPDALRAARELLRCAYIVRLAADELAVAELLSVAEEG